MLFVFKVSAPANTPYSNAVKTDLVVRAGVLTKVAVLVPSGHQALAHLIVKDGETPFIPEKGGIGVVGDGCIIHWEGWKDLRADPYKFSTEVWNEDDTHAHAFYLYMTILPSYLAYPFGKIAELLSQLLERFRIFKV